MNHQLAYGFAVLTLCAGLNCAEASLTFPNPTGTVLQSGTAGSVLGAVSLSDPNSGTATFNWVGTPYAAHITFETTTPWELNLDSLISSGGSGDFTAYLLDRLDGGGNAVARITSEIPQINAPGVLNGPGNLFGVVGATSSLGPVDSVNSGSLVGVLPAGTYRLGVFDSNQPDSATATFGIAAIPEPGALAVWSLLSGVGLVSCGRRKRTSDDKQNA